MFYRILTIFDDLINWVHKWPLDLDQINLVNHVFIRVQLGSFLVYQVSSNTGHPKVSYLR